MVLRGKGWMMPEEDMRSMLLLIQEKVCSSEIEVRHRDVLIRLGSMLERDLADLACVAESGVHLDQTEPELGGNLSVTRGGFRCDPVFSLFNAQPTF